MHAWSAVMLAAAMLLILSGTSKLRLPAPTITALRSVGLGRAGALLVRGLAGLEVAVGVAAVIDGGRLAAVAVALLYAGFSGFLLRALRLPTASCGCAGRTDTPPTVAHLVMTLMFSVAAVAAAATGGRDGLLGVTGSGGGVAVATALGLAAVVTWLGWVVLTVPAGLRRAVQP